MLDVTLKNPTLPTAALYRWALGTVMLVVIALGWRYPLLGFAVPVAMLTGMIGGFFRGRYVCGNLCPRGSFFDTFFTRFGPSRAIPKSFFSMGVRLPVMVVLMSFMTWQLSLDLSPEHWGLVFWQMCLITTMVALIFGMRYRPRTWCTICPVGTFSNVAGGKKHTLRIADSCRECALCEKSCPMGHAISQHKSAGKLDDGDCLQCGNCVQVCPAAALTLGPQKHFTRTTAHQASGKHASARTRRDQRKISTKPK